ncbi:DUF4129 domain-containing protein [Isoptericola sp. NPDC057391]|uniref:DUF4129 domain-containing protein n=1 Tax=Isoptericola sp. NPDC057391 TaxID=3346117 RepID=UPI00362A3C0C
MSGASAVVHGVMGALVADVPVDPDRETAHRWLLEELSRPEYSTEPSLLDRLLTWLGDLFDGLTLGEGRFPLAFVVVVVVVLVAALAWWVAGPVRLARRRRRSAVVLDGEERTAAELRASADAAAARGDWSAAVLDRFRALVRSLEERVVLDERPGRTAQEAAHDAAARLPAAAAELHDAARLFDDVCYGTLPAGPEDDRHLRDLDERVRGLRPAPLPAAAPQEVGAP